MKHADREKEFHRLMTQNKDLLWFVCNDYNLGPAWEVDDAFQEILVSLWRDFGSIRRRESERAWVYRVATNTMLGICRRKDNRPKTAPPCTGESTDNGSGYREEDYEYLRQLIDLLDEADRRVLRMQLDGFKSHEIASSLGISRSAVYHRLSRAINKLKRLYENGI